MLGTKQKKVHVFLNHQVAIQEKGRRGDVCVERSFGLQSVSSLSCVRPCNKAALRKRNLNSDIP